MNSFWITLLEINLVLSIVYAGYLVFLKNLTFFRWTRLYLLGGMMLGLVYPFLKTQQVVHPPAEGVNIIIPDIAKAAQTPAFDYSQGAVYLISAIFLLLFLRFLTRFFSLGKIHLASDKAEFNGRKFRNTRKQLNPFSFWKWIYIHRNSHSDFEMRQIMTHEHIHTRERHTFDVLVAEICTGIDRISYQHSLVGISLSGFPQPRHGNQFAFKTLKKRIRMMNKEQSSKFRLTSYLLLTPLVLGSAALLTFSCQKESVDIITKAQKNEEIALVEPANASAKIAATQGAVKGLIITKPVTPEEYFRAEKSGDTVAIDIPGNHSVTLRGTPILQDLLVILDGTPMDSEKINSIDPKTIESITVLKDASARALYGEKAKNGVILITTKTGKAGSRQ